MAKQQTSLVERLTGLADMVFVPFRDGQTELIPWSGGGGATYYPPGPLAGAEAAPGGPGGLVYFNATADPLAGTGGLRTTFKGRGLGLAYRNQPPSAQTAPSLSAVIDGEVFRVPKPSVLFNGEAQTGLVATESHTSVLIAGDLSDRDHTLELLMNADTTVNARLLLYGFWLDRRWYTDEGFLKVASLPPVAVPVAPTAALAVPTLPAALSNPAATAATDRKFRYVDRLDFTNTGTTAGDVILFRNATQVWRGTVPASGSLTYGGTAAMAMGDGAFTAQVATGGPTTINMTVWGRP